MKLLHIFQKIEMLCIANYIMERVLPHFAVHITIYDIPTSSALEPDPVHSASPFKPLLNLDRPFILN